MGEIEACQNGQDLELRQDQSGATSSQDLTAEGSAIPTDSKEDDQEHLLPRQKPRATYLTAHTFEDFGGRRHFGLEDGQGGASPGDTRPFYYLLLLTVFQAFTAFWPRGSELFS